jgi:hypothetical protein
MLRLQHLVEARYVQSFVLDLLRHSQIRVTGFDSQAQCNGSWHGTGCERACGAPWIGVHLIIA